MSRREWRAGWDVEGSAAVSGRPAGRDRPGAPGRPQPRSSGGRSDSRLILIGCKKQKGAKARNGYGVARFASIATLSRVFPRECTRRSVRGISPHSSMLLLLLLIIVEIWIEGRIGHEVLPDDVESAGVFFGNAIINTLHHIIYFRAMLFEEVESSVLQPLC